MSDQQPTILAVDDDPIILALIKEFLADRNYEFLTAECGEQALKLLQSRRNSIDVILLDRLMPDIDGLEVLRQVRQDSVLNLIPVILLTGVGGTDHAAEGIRAGAFYYLTKPIDCALLVEVVSKALLHHEIQTRLHNLRSVVKEEITKTHQATLMVAYDYLSNTLNQVQLLLCEIETKGRVDDEILREIKASVARTAHDMLEYRELENPNSKNSENFIKTHLKH